MWWEVGWEMGSWPPKTNKVNSGHVVPVDKRGKNVKVCYIPEYRIARCCI